MEPSKIQTEIASFIGRLLRDHFGKGPESVFVTIAYPFLAIYIRGLLSPTEKVLLAQKHDAILQQTRDAVMETLIPEIKTYLRISTGTEIHEFYYDWGLDNRTAIFIGISAGDSPGEQDMAQESFEGQEELEREVIELSRQAEKAPAEIHSYRLNARTYLVVRCGILVSIEKELIRMGLRETLRIAKRSLEKGLMHSNSRFEMILDTGIADAFVDWDFDQDKSVMAFIANPQKIHLGYHSD
jgi:uncharacterized protein YbcI